MDSRYQGYDNFCWEDVPVTYGGGGLVLVWNIDAFLKTKVRKGRWIYIEGKLLDKDILVAVVLVYSPNDREGRYVLWEDLIALKQEVECPMLILGDFNKILKPEERKWNSQWSLGIREFQAWQTEMGMLELPLLSRKFTWYRNNSASRIDRAFCRC